MESQHNPENTTLITHDEKKIPLPAIALDIDGVALRGSLIIGNADQVVK
jgi:hypothetical protein